MAERCSIHFLCEGDQECQPQYCPDLAPPAMKRRRITFPVSPPHAIRNDHNFGYAQTDTHSGLSAQRSLSFGAQPEHAWTSGAWRPDNQRRGTDPADKLYQLAEAATFVEDHFGLENASTSESQDTGNATDGFASSTEPSSLSASCSPPLQPEHKTEQQDLAWDQTCLIDSNVPQYIQQSTAYIPDILSTSAYTRIPLPQSLLTPEASPPLGDSDKLLPGPDALCLGHGQPQQSSVYAPPISSLDHPPQLLSTLVPESARTFIPPAEIAEVRKSIADLLEEMRSCMSPYHIATRRDSYYGTARILFANGVKFASERMLGQPDDKEDVIRMSQEQFRQLMQSGNPPSQPVIIAADPGFVTGANQVDAFHASLKYGYSNTLIDVQNISDGDIATAPGVVRIEAAALDRYLLAHPNAPLTHTHWPRNLLNLHGMMTANAPPRGISEPATANILKHALFRRRAAANNTSAGKGGALTPYAAIDYAESCLAFTLFSQRGCFSGCHMDVFAGTWVRSLSGRKLWPLCFDLSPSEWTDFCTQGPSFIPPREKLRCVLIREGETLIMPPSGKWVHCPLTIEDCLMDGGMFWTAEQIPATLGTLGFIAENVKFITNEDVPESLPEILDALLDVLREMGREQMQGIEEAVALLKDICLRPSAAAAPAKKSARKRKR